MGQYEQHVFECTSGEPCPEQGDTEQFVKIRRERAKQAGQPGDTAKPISAQSTTTPPPAGGQVGGQVREDTAAKV